MSERMKSSADSISIRPADEGREPVPMRPWGEPVLKENTDWADTGAANARAKAARPTEETSVFMVGFFAELAWAENEA